MQRIIGLDIGSYSIKAVEIVNTLKSYEIINFYENVVPALDNVPIDVVASGCMEQLFKENNLDADRIVTAMPGQFISSRVLALGFSDPRKIETAVYSEMEDAAPFNMDDMVLDHQVLGDSHGGTVTLAVMTRKAFLKNFLDLLQRVGIDPKLVDVDSLAFYNLASYMPSNPGESFAMVDIGHEKTSVCIVRDGVLRLFRSINLGGRYITEFLARDFEISFHDAQRRKHEVSRVFCQKDPLKNTDSDDERVIERTTLAANAIIKELGRTFYAFKTWEKDPLSHIYLSGGTSVIKNLPDLIQDQLEVETLHCRLDQTELKINPDLNTYMSVLPQSVAIGIRTVSSARSNSQINLRKGEFSFVQNYEQLIKVVDVGARIAAVMLLLLVLSYSVKYFIYQKHIDRLREQYTKELNSVVDNEKQFAKIKSFPVLRKKAESQLRSQIALMRDSVSVFRERNSSSPSLVLLKQLSEAIPKDVKVDVTLYDFKSIDNSESRLVIKAETEGYASQASVIDAMKKVSSLKNVAEKNSGTKPGSDGKIIEFTVQADYDDGFGGKG